jgi:ABC-2 type transport system ATP-binding protein
MDEAERCDRVAILHRGSLITAASPSALKNEVGGDVVVLQTPDPQPLSERIRERFGRKALIVDHTLRVEGPRGHEFVRDVVEAFPAEITLATYGKPTLEDVFVHLTGHRFWAATDEDTVVAEEAGAE